MSDILLIEADEYRELVIPGIEKSTPLDIVHPLGLMTLAAILREKDKNRNIKILDTRLLKRDYSTLPDLIKKINPFITGVRLVSRAMPFAKDLIKKIKELCPMTHIIAGGPHVTACKEKILSNEHIEAGVYGEGDITFPLLVERLENNSDYRDLDGIIYRDKGRSLVNRPREFVENLDEIPFPAWDLIDRETYFDFMYNPHSPIYFNVRRQIASIFTSRGCPFSCNFCHNIFGKKVRFQSPEKTFFEIKKLYEEFGMRQFHIWDDIFNINKERVRKICDMVIEEGLDINFTFPNGLRGDIIDKELVVKLKAAGTAVITYAVETGSKRLQKATGKNIDLKKLKEAIHFTSSLGIIVRVFIILGFPGETEEEMKETLGYIMDRAIDTAVFQVLNPFEGTGIYEEVKKEGIDPSSFQEKYDYISPNFSSSSMVSSEKLKEIYYNGVAGFFTMERVNRSYNKWIKIHRYEK
jgi:radical SAM superfamily enzyme YgiQ (UPF0313 family)